MDTEKLKTFDCPLNLAISVLSGKYKIEIMFCLYIKTMRFNELQRHIPKASSKVLSQQLKELEADGMIMLSSVHRSSEVLSRGCRPARIRRTWTLKC